MAILVFTLCAITSLAVAVLLLRGYGAQDARLLLWSGLCFLGFAVGNAMLIADTMVPSRDLSIFRSLPVLLGLLVLLYGLVWDSR